MLFLFVASQFSVCHPNVFGVFFTVKIAFFRAINLALIWYMYFGVLFLIHFFFSSMFYEKKWTFDFVNPQLTSLYHKNSSNNTNFYFHFHFWVPKTVLLEDTLNVQYVSTSQSLPPTPSPFAGGSSGSTSFIPGQFIDAHTA